MSSTRPKRRGPGLALALAVAALVLVPAAALGVAGDFGQPSTSPETIGVGDVPYSIAASNLIGDANTDLAILNRGSGSVSILRGDGTGDFVSAAAAGVGNGAEGLAAADLDGDSDTDLAVANGFDQNVTILLNNGSGFAAPVTSPEPSGGIQDPSPTSIVAANFDGGTDIELAVTNPGSGFADDITILQNNGSADFTALPPQDLANDKNIDPQDLAAADLGGDANIDLAVANAAGPTSFADRIGILIGNGTGVFTDPVTSPESAGSTLPGTSIAAANFDGDSDADLAVTNVNADNVTILLNSGGSDFAAPGSSPEATGDLPVFVTAANLNNDASIDLAVANLGSDSVTILLGEGTGNFTAAPSSPEAAGDAPNALAAANFGGTTSTDLAVANSFSDNVTILLNELAPPVIPPVVPPTTVTPPVQNAAPPAPKKKCKKKGKKGAAAAKKKKKKC